MNENDRRLLRLHASHMNRHSARDETVRQRRGNLERLVDLTGKELTTITADDLDVWQEGLRRRLKPASVRAYTSHVRAFYAWAHHTGHLEVNPAADLLTPKVRSGRPRPIAEDRLAVAIVGATEPVKTWLILSAYCGLRAGEIARLTRDSVGEGMLFVDGKGGRPRSVKLPADVLAFLEPHIVGAGAIFRGRDGRPITPGQVSRRSCRYLRSIGVDDTLHAGRHRYGTRIYRLSRDLRAVQEALGHASPATTAIYVAASAEAVGSAADELAKALRGLERAS